MENPRHIAERAAYGKGSGETDGSGTLKAGIPFYPPEGDAGDGHGYDKQHKEKDRQRLGGYFRICDDGLGKAVARTAYGNRLGDDAPEGVPVAMVHALAVYY